MSWLKRSREVWRVAIPAVLILIAGFAFAYRFVGPPPPRNLVVAAGPREGAYFTFAEHYRAAFAKQGIELKVLETAGSVANLELLQNEASRVDFAFVQSGIRPVDKPKVELRSLGSLYDEPVWFFHRATIEVERLSDLKGKRIAIGAPQSGTRALALELLAANGITAKNATLLEMGGSAARSALSSRETDAAVFVLQARAPLAIEMLADPTLRLLDVGRAPAYHTRFPYLKGVTLYEGMADLERNLPARDMTLLAPAATLVARADMHPALVDLLMQIIQAEHSDDGGFAEPGDFPSPNRVEFPLSSEAERFYRFGPPFLQRIMPFWIANAVDRLKVMLIPLLTLLLPLAKVVPSIYDWRVRSKIHRQYGRLLKLEGEAYGDGDREELHQKLDAIENDVTNLHLPLSYSGQAYQLREHVKYVRERIERGGPAGA